MTFIATHDADGRMEERAHEAVKNCEIEDCPTLIFPLLAYIFENSKKKNEESSFERFSARVTFLQHQQRLQDCLILNEIRVLRFIRFCHDTEKISPCEL